MSLTHEYNTTISDGTSFNEIWKLVITQGDVTTMIMARNMTQNNITSTDYQFDINYWVGSTIYIAQITINQIEFVIGGQTITSNLFNCDNLEMTCSPVQYNDGVPSLYCNITYSGLDVYSDTSIHSTYNLTLSNYIVMDQNQTDVKVGAQIDLSDLRLMSDSSGQEFNAGEIYAVNIQYVMELTLPNSHGTPINPTNHNDTSLAYSLNSENGDPITVSKLTMDNDFSVSNGSGAYNSTGYSSMQYGSTSQVTQGFPDLAYKDAQLITSDPELVIYHTNASSNSSSQILIPAAVVGAIAVICVASIIFVRRKKRREGKRND